MKIDHILIILLLSYFIDNFRIYFNYELTTILIIVNIVGMYFILTSIEINLSFRYRGIEG